MLCRGEPPFLRLRPRPDAPDAARAFEAAFERLRPGAGGKGDRRSCGLPLKSLRDSDSDTDVVFVPMHDLQHRRNATTGRWTVEREMCFWCYRVAPGSVFSAISWVTASRMPVVWDLDDTLVVANGEGALRDKREKARPWVALLLHVPCTARTHSAMLRRCSIARQFAQCTTVATVCTAPNCHWSAM